MINFTESSIPSNYAIDILNNARMDIPPADVENLYKILFSSFAEFLAGVKKKDKSAAIVVEDLKGDFKMASIVKYHENENKDMPGNWSYEHTFNEEDIKDIDDVYRILDKEFEIVTAGVAHRLCNMMFSQPTYLYDIMLNCVTTLIKYLDENATEGEVTEIELPGYFVASVGVSDGKKEMSLVPGDAMKREVKEDAAL